jgi:CRP/FNR family cyclic AMP-dependent transcriptional regulator
LQKNDFRNIDLNTLTHLQSLEWLSRSEVERLVDALITTEFEKYEIIFRERTFAHEAQILLKGVARLTCKTPRGEKVTLALLGPGPLPGLPSLVHFEFACEAYRYCRVGSLSWREFAEIIGPRSKSAFESLHESDSRQCNELLMRGSQVLNLPLHDRVALTMLELASSFGMDDSGGRLLHEQFSHQELAELVGASRPRITESLAKLEREGLIARRERRFVVNVNKIEKMILSKDGGVQP